MLFCSPILGARTIVHNCPIPRGQGKFADDGSYFFATWSITAFCMAAMADGELA